ncbi:F-box domain-containing protein [Mycena sanguinolenta]|uniref:F-box domain-containing protein n=1 Tax=Mycena sanguinolenta TaxID=230812 RepID=A0A8H6X3V6_9AGAR|nr:F-box domain-containing protein [Mycena sanguinolenta]
MTFNLPPELWLDVFKSLPRSSLTDVHAVSSQFSELSRPLLFSDFIFFPPHAYDERLERDERELARLTFWSSPKIAPYVRRCVVNLNGAQESVLMDPRTPSLIRTGLEAVARATNLAALARRVVKLAGFGESADSRWRSLPLVWACFEAVSRFTNLEKLTCHTCRTLGVELPALRVHDLPSLKSLHIGTAHLIPSVISPPIKIRIEHFTHTGMPFPEPGRRSQMLSLDTSTLCRVDLASDAMFAVQHFLEDTHAQASFRNLQVVNITVFETTFAELHASIAPFPAIRELGVKIRSRSLELGDLPSPLTPIAPHLSKFQGPADLLPLILVGSAPRTLHISRGPALELLRGLHSSGRTTIDSVMSLVVTTQYPDIAEGSILSDSLAFFPALEELRVVVHSGPYCAVAPITREALCAHIAATLRPFNALRKAVFDWGLKLDDPSENVPPLPMLDSALREAMPGFESVKYERFNPWA